VACFSVAASCALAETSACSGYRILSFSPRSPRGELGSSATACRFETETFLSSPWRCRQIALGDIAAVLVPVEAGIDSCPAGDRCAMAPRRLQAALGPGSRGIVSAWAGSGSALNSASLFPEISNLPRLSYPGRLNQSKTNSRLGTEILVRSNLVECPARFVPVEVSQTGTRGGEHGTRKEA
jgi:hypothetical protein